MGCEGSGIDRQRDERELTLSREERHELGPSPRQLEAVQRPSAAAMGKLTDDDLDAIEGKRTELVGKIQSHYGYARERAEDEVETFCASCK